MKKYVYIGLFGALGAVSRYAVKSIDLSTFFQHFPMNTLIINLTGCFVFALIITVAYETGKINHNLRLGLTAGFLGAYTTFSSFCKDTILSLQGGYYTDAATYVVLSVVIGLALTHDGTIVAKAYVMRLIRKLKSLILAATGDNLD